MTSIPAVVRQPAGGVDNLLLCCDSYKVKLRYTWLFHVLFY